MWAHVIGCWMENVTVLSHTDHFLTTDSWLVEKLQFGSLNMPQLFDAELLQNAKEAAKMAMHRIDLILRSPRWHLKRTRSQPKPPGFPSNPFSRWGDARGVEVVMKEVAIPRVLPDRVVR